MTRSTSRRRWPRWSPTRPGCRSSGPILLAIGRYWADRVEDLLRACTDDRDTLPADRSIDVRFDEFMADDLGTVERIYELAGQPFAPASRDAMDAYLPRPRP